MGLTCSPDYDQEVMENILCGVKDAEFYIDYVGVFSHPWDAHITLLLTILTKLQENDFTVNPLKCEWTVKETDWLSHWLTPQDLNLGKRKWMLY